MRQTEDIIYRAWLYKKIFIENKRKAAITISGGADSALALYLTCEYTMEYNIQDFSIIPVHGWDASRKNAAYSPDTAKHVISYIQKKFKDVDIKDTYFFAYSKRVDETKNKYHLPAIELLETEGYCEKDFIIQGSTLVPLNKDFWAFLQKKKHEIDYSSVLEQLKRRGTPSKIPNGLIGRNMFSRYDKKWVAQKYIEKNLQDLFPYTVSCIQDYSYPCKNCLWCLEKYWAFGAYDGEELVSF